MGRDKRSIVPGGIYHVMNRGNRKGLIFEDDQDRQVFRRIEAEELEIYRIKKLADSLMGNHFHSALLTPLGNLSDFMEQLQGRYARYSNLRYGRVGHLFQGPYRLVHIEDDVHLLTTACYIFMNPVVAGFSPTLEGYRWSSYAATAGFTSPPPNLTMDWLLTMYPRGGLPEAQLRFRELMSKPKPVMRYLQESELDVDPEAIKQVIRSYTGQQFDAARLPHTYRTKLRPPLDELLHQRANDRVSFIRDARMLYGYRTAEIAKVLNIHSATVSKIFCCHRRRQSSVSVDMIQSDRLTTGTNASFE